MTVRKWLIVGLLAVSMVSAVPILSAGESKMVPAPFPSAAPAEYVGSKKSNIFHDPECTWAKKILPQNRITWKNRGQAIKGGKRACKVCKP